MTDAVHAWTGKILRVDLTARRIEVEDTLTYAHDYIGGRGIATRIAWNELKPGVGPFDADNPLMIMTGPLTGTTAPFSGRTTLATTAPQAYPTPWFTRASLGGHWGPELKYAGFDGLVVTGIADFPVYLWIEDGQASIRDARDLWGLGIYDTQLRLFDRHGKDIRVLAIGQAGEHLSRIAIISTETESAAGQGGFGGVMGSKNLKAVACRGRGRLTIARPAEFTAKCRAIAKEAHASHGWPHNPQLDPVLVTKYGQKFQACTQQCAKPCRDARYYTHVPGVLCPNKTYAGQVDCIAALFPGIQGTFYDWNLGFEAGFEVGRMTNDFGLNQWDLLIGIVPWLRACRDEGLVRDLDGIPIDLDNPRFWAELFRKIAYREGMGAALAEGGRRAPAILGFGQDLIDKFYTAWGYAGHWDGHADKINYIFYPYWIVAALQWAVDTRDPISSGHGYVQSMMCWNPVRSPQYGITWEQMKAVGADLYGTPDAVDPEKGYEAKEVPAVWHGHRSIMKDSLPLDDQIFPRVFSRYTPDGRSRTDDMLGTSFEYELFTTSTGLDITEADFEGMCERIMNLDRALLIRNYGRSRADDETVIPAFEYPENVVNPLVGSPQTLDRGKFLALLDAYYRLRDWDPETGHPTQATLTRVGLADVAQELAPQLPA